MVRTENRTYRMMPKIGGKQLVSYHVKRIKMQRAGTPHYMAPEMIRGRYDQICDIFSIGIVMCQVLTGVHPFYIPGVDDENSVEVKILLEHPPMNGPEWAYVSPAAKDLCRAMIRKKPQTRPSAQEALHHPWFDQVRQKSANLQSSLVSASVFEGLKNWQSQNKLKQAVVQLLAKELNEHEIRDLRKKFLALDRKKDGMISLDEVRNALKASGYTMLDSELKAIFQGMGEEGVKGKIGYNAFISALLCNRMSFQEHQLRDIFNKFDINKEGRVSVETLQKALKGTRRYDSLNTTEVEEIFEQVDKNKDGYLDFYEFLDIMTSKNST